MRGVEPVNLMLGLRATTFAIAFCIASCATTASPQAVAPKDTLTLENLLRWSLQGPAGADKAIVSLKEASGAKEIRPSLYAADGPVELVDGYTLGSISIGVGRSFDVNVRDEHCFAAEKAASMIGAVASDMTADAHGLDQGRTCSVVENGIRVVLTATSVTSRCVKGIYVRAVKENKDERR